MMSTAFGAAIGIFIITMLLFKSLSPTYSESDLFNRFYEPLTDNSFQLRGSEQEKEHLFSEGVNEYLAGNYESADLKFDQLITSGVEKPEVLLYAGLTKTAIEDYVDAIVTLNNLLQNSDQYSPEAKWYLGLCYLKTGNTVKTKAILEDLIAQKMYTKKAQALLRNL